jgi:general secretion pathway protein L
LLLVIHLPDLARFEPTSVAPWQLIDNRGEPLRRGASTLDQAPRAPQVIALVPASRVVFIETPLPSTNVSPQKRDQLVRYAIEDKLTIDPATVHAVVLDARPAPRARGAARNSNHIVAAIDRVWFGAALQWMKSQGLPARSVFAETALLPVAPGEWSVKLADADSRHAYACRGDGFAYALDTAGGNAPPFALTLALNEAPDKPQAITLYASGTLDPALPANWQAALGVPIRIATAAAASGRAIGGLKSAGLKSGNLLTGDFAPVQPARAWVSLAKPALVVAAVMASLHVVFTVADWWRLDRERQRLEAELKQTFQSAFPQANAIVDAPLQMRRNLEQLKRERGMVKPDDPRTALARLAAIIIATPQVSVTEVTIKDGQATLAAKLAPDSDAAMAALQERVAGIAGARLSAGSAPNTIEITVRVGA